jgi:hypothetical protein
MGNVDDEKRLRARQLKELMERRNVKNSAEYERIFEKRKDLSPVNQVTIRRILDSEGKEGPKRKTLRSLADAVGETLESAFPDEGTGVAEWRGRKVGFHGADGRPLSPREIDEFIESMKDASVEKAQRIHEAKKKPKL